MEQQPGAMQQQPSASQQQLGAMEQQVGPLEELLDAAEKRRAPSKASAIASDELAGATLNRRATSEHSPGEPQERRRRAQQARGPAEAIRL
jgi:hypothetical protein